MTPVKRVRIWVTIAIIASAAAGATIFIVRFLKNRQISMTGAVIRRDSDSNKELPIADVEITAANGVSAATTKSDSTGFFRLKLGAGIRRDQPVTLHFRHADYQPLDMTGAPGDKLYIAQLIPLPHESPRPDHPDINVGNLVVRYSVKATTTVNVGSAAKAFQVVNKGNVRCNGQHPCSPDGKWKAAVGSASLDAGEGNVFQNARASCIAGPCPFTRIENDNFSNGGRNISVSVRNWSDTTSFLLEAEVVHRMDSDMTRRSYPVVFGQALNFTLPPLAEGVTIEADVNGEGIVFPLGPDLFLSWAQCNSRVNRDQTKVYRCELKPGYRFR